MTTLIQILLFLISTFASLYLLAICLRFLMQLSRADFYNPISQLVVKLTAPLLMPLRKVIPGLWGLDLASLVLALVFHALVITLMVLVAGGGWLSPLSALFWSLLGTLLYVVHIYLVLFFIIMIASFVAPYSRHPVLMLCQQLAEPLLSPLRRVLPATGGLDFSMFFASIGLFVVRMALYGMAAGAGVPMNVVLGFA
jgi:YggT family protein